jgi:hypothetical protein
VSLVSIERIEVGARHLDARIRLTDQSSLRTSASPEAASRALQLLPGLARHSCENDLGARFVDELRDTETAHLLEHVAVELMALSGSPRSLKARTSWDFSEDGPGVFRIRMEYDNDLVAISALSEAAAIVEAVMSPDAEPSDVDAAVERLRDLRKV